jgi:thiol:disulfide interchange protein
MRMLCSSTLLAEFFVIGFAGLVAMKDPDLTATTVWTVCGVLMAVSLLLCGIVGKPLGVRLGWGLQIALVVSGFFVPMMFVLGLCFTGLWWASLHFGRKVDEAKAHWAAQSEDATVTPGPDAA